MQLLGVILSKLLLNSEIRCKQWPVLAMEMLLKKDHRIEPIRQNFIHRKNYDQYGVRGQKLNQTLH